MNTSADVRPYRRGEGYLAFMGYLQILTGTLSVLFSATAVLTGLGDSSLLNPAATAGDANGWFMAILTGYITLQMTVGWIPGLLQIAAGVCCLRHRAPGFVTFASWVNLVNFPHGTTTSLMMLYGISRWDLLHGFARRV